ncbi:MAG: tRNA pseudouridine13 synthase [archaeon GW2011_AR3]|nr:MAG: tRNA pseudouridine13 synthase [archaeon GW2011_AR3]MBS3109313.1 tRNA pseudouridine(13) synthase TruD [Candidatus Woesearchaeota archaeon]
MYKIKQVNADFRVLEDLKPDFGDNGTYSYYLLEKEGVSTGEAISRLARHFGIEKKKFGYAGNKDKRAQTQQVISIQGIIQKQPVELGNLSLKYLGRGHERINLGDNSGNNFEIVVRNLDANAIHNKISFIPNYFDTQRFSTANFQIGISIIQKKWNDALSLLTATKQLQKHDVDTMHGHSDPIRQIRTLDKRLLMIFVHSVQSKIFNELLCSCIKSGKGKYREFIDNGMEFCFPENKSSEQELPLVGFGTEINEESLMHKLNELLSKYGIRQRDFIIRELPGLSSEGHLRKAFVDVQNLTISDLEDDDLNTGKKKCTVSFSLPKGSYATIVIKSMFGQ